MGAPTNTFIDPTSGTDDTVGDRGAVGNPYKSTQFSLDNTTRDSSNGDRINIKAGGTDTLSAALSLTTYGTPTGTAPLVFQGYTSAQGDRGIGDIDGGGNAIFSVAKTGIHFIDLKLHNSASNVLLNLAASRDTLISCEIYDCDTDAVLTGAGFLAVGCYFHDINGKGVNLSRGSVLWCYFKNGSTQKFGGDGAVTCSTDDLVAHCIFDLDGNSYGITTGAGAHGVVIINNTIYHPGGGSTNSGIIAAGNSVSCVMNNYIEGMAAGGITLNSGQPLILGHNSAFNNTTDFQLNGDVILNVGKNTSLSVTGLTDPSNGDFSPTDVDEMQSGGYLEVLKGLSTTSASIDIGAVQAVITAAAAGGRRYRGLVPGGGLGA